MSNIIRVDTQTLMNYAREFQNLARRLFNVQQTLSSLYNQTHIVGLSTIANRRTVSQCGEIMLNCSEWCLDTFQDFQNVENFLVQQNPENFERPSKMVIDEYHNTSKDGLSSEYIENAGKLIRTTGKITDISAIKNTGKGFKYVESVMGVLEGPNESETILKKSSDLTTSSIGMFEMVYKDQLKKLPGYLGDSKVVQGSQAESFYAKYHTKIGWLKAFGDGLDILSGAEKMYKQDSIGDALLNSDDLISGTVSAGSDILDIAGNKMTTPTKMAVESVLVMGGHLTGGVIKANEDGEITQEEVSEIAFDTSYSGAKVLTFDILDEDITRENVDAGGEWLRSHSAVGQITLALPTSVYVMGKSIIQSGWQDIDNFVSALLPLGAVISEGSLPQTIKDERRAAIQKKSPYILPDQNDLLTQVYLHKIQ